MTAKQYLKQIRDLDSRAAICQAYIKLCQRDIYRMGRDFAPTVDKLVDFQREAQAAHDGYVDERQAIILQVRSLGYPYAEILYKVYAEYKSLKEAMLEMHFTSYKYVARLHGQALQEFTERYLKN